MLHWKKMPLYCKGGGYFIPIVNIMPLFFSFWKWIWNQSSSVRDVLLSKKMLFSGIARIRGEDPWHLFKKCILGQLKESISSKMPIILTSNCLQDMYCLYNIYSNFSPQLTCKYCILTSEKSSTSCTNWGGNSDNARKKAIFLRRTSLSQFSQYSTLRKYCPPALPSVWNIFYLLCPR